MVGVEGQADTTARQRNFDVDAAINSPVDVDSRRRRVGAYVQDEWSFSERWRVNAGLRRDTFSTGESSTSPRLGLIWLASDTTSWKLLGGRAFRVPNAYERSYANGVAYLANPDLRPETIRTVEAVLEQQITAQQHLRVALFDYRIYDLITQQDVGGGLLQYRNQPAVKAHGIELAWRTRWESGAAVQASLGVNQAKDAMGQRPGFSPRWVGKLRGNLPVAGERWMLSADLRGTSATPYQWNGTWQRLASRYTVDAALTSAHVAPGLDGHLRVRNLLDRKVFHPSSDEAPVPWLPDDGRTLELGVTYGF